jgi:hypothetical protein
VVLAVVFMPAFPMPLAPSSCHPCSWYSPFPPHEQLLVAAVQGAAVLADMGVVWLQGGGNRSIPSGYPPLGVSQCPSYIVCHMLFIHHMSFVIHHLFIVHCSYVIRLSFVCCRTSFVCHLSLYVVICPLLSFVLCTLLLWQ